MTTKRVTVPEGHRAVILSEQLAAELQSLLQIQRRAGRTAFSRWKDGSPSSTLSPTDQDRIACFKIAGDVLLALLESEQ